MSISEIKTKANSKNDVEFFVFGTLSVAIKKI